MGHVEMASTTEGIEALLYTHNAQLHDHHLRVTFSKGSQHAQQPVGASSMGGFPQAFAGYQ